MTPATRNVIAGTSLAFLAIVGGILYGTRTATPGPGARSSTVDWDGPVPDDVICLRTTGLASPQALRIFSLDAGAPGDQYVYVRICGSPVDAGEGDVALPPGMIAFDTFQIEEPYDGGPQMRASLDDFPCACSVGADCEAQALDGGWAEAPIGATLLEGQWRGACVRKACVELAGVSSWPEACPQ